METLTDIVFEKRNKAYGAYVLRKEYKSTLGISLLLAFFLLASAFAWPIYASYNSKPVQGHGQTDITVTIDRSVKPDIPAPPPAAPALPEVKFKFVPPKVVDENVESGLMTQDDLGKSVASAPLTSLPPDDATPAPPPEKVIPLPVDDKPVLFVQEMPTFNGGDAALYSYLSANLKYPLEARETGISGKVYVEFVIERDGSVSNVQVKRGIGAGCDEEAVRVVASMPKWNPGKQNGQAARVLLVLPVKFVLN